MRAFVPDFDIVPAGTMSELLSLLGSGEGWKPIAGGTDLMVLFNAGKLPFRKLVSIRSIEELRGIAVTDEYIELGAATTYSDIRRSAILRDEYPLLGQAASWTGGIANQNRGTLGGNIANASPAADSAPALLVYDAELEVASRKGSRVVCYSEFHSGYKQMDLREEELIAAIRLPRHSGDWRQYGRKVGTRKAQAISKVSLAAAARVESGTIMDIRLGLGSVAPVPLRCRETEAVLRGERLTANVQAAAQQTLRREIRPISDIRSTSEYRSLVAVNLLGEYLESLR